MNFQKKTRFNQPYWFSGIYKISKYTWYNGHNSKPYYHVYKLSGKQWGDYVGGKPAQYDKQLSFDECVQLAEHHAKTYEPSKNELKQAKIALDSWIGMDSSN